MLDTVPLMSSAGGGAAGEISSTTSRNWESPSQAADGISGKGHNRGLEVLEILDSAMGMVKGSGSSTSHDRPQLSSTQGSGSAAAAKESVTWLRRTEYLAASTPSHGQQVKAKVATKATESFGAAPNSTSGTASASSKSSHRPTSATANNETITATASAGDYISELNTPEDVIRAIEASFHCERKHLKHPTRSIIHPVAVHPILPSSRSITGSTADRVSSSAVVTFDADPTSFSINDGRGSESDATQGALLVARHNTLGLPKSWSYYVPSSSSAPLNEDDVVDAENGDPLELYANAREFDLSTTSSSISGGSTMAPYFVVTVPKSEEVNVDGKSSSAQVAPVATSLVLKKRRGQSDSPQLRKSLLLIKHTRA
jgi:hypothetical protein